MSSEQINTIMVDVDNINNIVYKKTILEEMDVGIKFFLLGLVSCAIFICNDYRSFVLITVFCGVVTAFSGIKRSSVWKSIMFVCFAIVLPYIFGFIMNEIIHMLKYGKLLYTGVSNYIVLIKMVRVLLISYISTLYFQTTSIDIAASFFDKLFLPLCYLRIPVSEYLKILIIIINRIYDNLNKFKDSFLEKFYEMRKEKRYSIKEFLKFSVNFIVDSTVDSLHKVDEVQDIMNKEFKNDLNVYKFKVSRSELVGAIGFGVLITLIIIIESKF